MPKRILIVDDDPLMLKKTLASLRALAPEWQAEGVQSASLGLEAFAREPFEAVLADLAMPGMGGSEFLQQIMARYPSTIRIVIYEEGERNQALQSLGWAHQFLAKPLDTGYLRSMLQAISTQGSQVGNTHVRELVARIGQLPAVPEIYQEITALLESDYGTTEKLGQIVAKDMAMTAMILKLANSAYFSLRQPVSDPGEAAAYLGVDLLKALVLAHGLFGQVGAFRIPTFSIYHLWTHSLSVATAAKRIADAEGEGSQKSVECFTAGILHDIGLLILASRFPEDYVKVLDLSRMAGGALEAAEHHVFGATHGEVGAYLLTLWALPTSVVEAAAYHHAPRLQSGTGFTPTLAVHVADALHGEHADHEIFTTARVDRAYLDELDLLGHLAEWRAGVESLGAART